MPQKRPFGVTLLLWMVLMSMAWGGVRLISALRWWDLLTRYASSLSPLYLAVTGAAWAMAGLTLFWGAFTGKLWARRTLIIATVIGLIQYWVERLFFQTPLTNLRFSIVASLVIASLALLILNHRSTKDFFTRSEAYEQPNETSDPE